MNKTYKKTASKRTIFHIVHRTSCLLPLLIFFLLAAFACTSDFDKINTQPGAVTAGEASARYFLTNVQFNLYGPGRFAYWRGPLIHGDRYAGYFTFGHKGCWWNDGLGYTYNSGYTDATFNWLAGYLGELDNFLKITDKGGAFENSAMHAVGLIMKGLYFGKFTDIFGEIPYSEAGDPKKLTPKFDTQSDIYQGIIADLNKAMTLIGTAKVSGEGIKDMADNDLFYKGDLQKWKKLANTLKLKMGMRALGAPGAGFAKASISEAVSNPLMELTSDDAVLKKDEVISMWNSAAYGDIWHRFGGLGSKWHIGEVLISALRDNADPRLRLFAKPAAGGVITLKNPVKPDEIKAFARIKQTLDDAGVVYNTAVNGKDLSLSFASNKYYVGQPTRFNRVSYDFAGWEVFSTPADVIINPKNGGPISAELILSSADAFLLRALAVVEGVIPGDANTFYQAGVSRSMEHWGVSADAITQFLANSPMGSLKDSAEKMKEQINTQRWIANYTNGFEGWAIVRKTGYPAALASGVTDGDIFSLGEINGAYPQRMRYGNSARDKNGTNLNEALGRQGADTQDTKLWWAKK